MVSYKRELENGRELEFLYRDVDHDKLMIFLPGISGNALNDRFRFLEEVAVHSGYSLIRMDFQFQQYNDKTMTIKDCLMDIRAILEYVRRRDINTAKEIVIIAKSFGALVYHMLDDENMNITGAILLAPYVRLKDSMIDFTNIPISELKEEQSFVDTTVLKDIPTLIFHGHKDNIIDAENSQKLVEAKPSYILEMLNTNHSYEEPETHNIIIKKTAKFLNG